MTSISEAVVKLSHRENLSFDESASVMDSIMNGECTPVTISCYLTALATKGETVDEIAGSATEMRNHALKLPGDHEDALEIVAPDIGRLVVRGLGNAPDIGRLAVRALGNAPDRCRLAVRSLRLFLATDS